MPDMRIGDLPEALALDDNSLLVTEQQGEARHFKGALLKAFAKEGVDALVAAAQEAATKATQAAAYAQRAADSVQDVSADAEAAATAANAAESAKTAAVAAQTAAEQAAELAAQQAAQEATGAVDSKMADYVSAAEAAQAAAEKARDEAQSIAGGEFATEAYTNERIATHNTATDAHNDIRLLIEGLTTRLNALADSDDTTLDQMSEVVAYIKSNKTLIESITTSKVNVSDIVDDLVTNVANKPLSAAQGVTLKSLVDAATSAASSKADANHTQAASTITAGTFAGQVVANASGQTPGTSLLRNSKLVSADATPSNNGEINWTYG